MLADGLAYVLIALSTFVSEDLTCIATGMAAATHKVALVPGIIACASGIFAGDLLLFAAGRILGRPAVKMRPLKWFVTERKIEESSRWFAAKGHWLILTSRFIPGTRLPTYFAAGLLKVNLVEFMFWFALAALLWTPLIVSIAYFLGSQARVFFEESHILPILALLAAALYFSVHLLLSLVTFRGRRMLAGKCTRMRWEFWPSWATYPPIVFYCVYLAIRFKGPLLFTASNPGIESSGVIGESKSRILDNLPIDSVAKYKLIPSIKEPPDQAANERASIALSFMAEHALTFPIVIKPDQGQRGSGVQIARSEQELTNALKNPKALIIQEYISGLEFGILYARMPDEETGRILSITRKTMPHLVGDGRQTLEEMILRDHRAVALAEHYCNANQSRLTYVPKEGESIQLVELGTHARGSIFLNGADLQTISLEQEIDRISKCFRGFYLGRYDIRVKDESALMRAEGIRILELNGVTSEPTHIYDPAVSVIDAYRALFEQWRLAYAIGASNRQKGFKPMTVREMISLLTSAIREPETESNPDESKEPPQQTNHL